MIAFLAALNTGVRVLLHHNKRRFSWLFGVILIAIIATGCSSNRWGFPYKVGLQQGNWVTQQQVGLLYEGMTREQVRFALGSPTLTSVLHADRWEYPYFYKSPNGDVEERHLAVFFSDGALTKWQGDEQPDRQPFQMAEEEVEMSQSVEQEVTRDQALFNEPSGVIEIEPGIDFSTVIETVPITDPGAPPDVPDQTPVGLE